MKSELIQPTHLARKAIVYIRQSTPAQVVSNQESLRLQYALMQRARDLGWREADVDVIDADLGLSGASAVQRQGFKELTARVSLSEVGLILSLDVTRLARNCSDWYPLLDICTIRTQSTRSVSPRRLRSLERSLRCGAGEVTRAFPKADMVQAMGPASCRGLAPCRTDHAPERGPPGSSTRCRFVPATARSGWTRLTAVSSTTRRFLSPILDPR